MGTALSPGVFTDFTIFLLVRINEVIRLVTFEFFLHPDSHFLWFSQRFTKQIDDANANGGDKNNAGS